MPMVDGKQYPYTLEGIGAANRARAGATTPAGGSPFSRVRGASAGPLYGPNHRQKPPIDTHGTFGPASGSQSPKFSKTNGTFNPAPATVNYRASGKATTPAGGSPTGT